MIESSWLGETITSGYIEQHYVKGLIGQRSIRQRKRLHYPPEVSDRLFWIGGRGIVPTLPIRHSNDPDEQ